MKINYECTNSHFLAESKEQLDVHILNQNKKCNLCDDKYNNNVELESHDTKSHISCGTCNATLLDRDKLDKYIYNLSLI